MLSRKTSLGGHRAALAHACVACKQPWAVRAVRNSDGVYLLVCRFCSWHEARPVDGERGQPATTDPTRGVAEHEVLFYDAEAELMGHLVSFVTAGVAAEETCLIIASAPHRAALHARLDPFALRDARVHGRFVELDAATTLALFMHDGRPDAVLFDQTVGVLVRDQAAGGHRVRAYGEMVALLWTQGAVHAALELEALWNVLQRQVDFVLLCAYRSGDVLPHGHAGRSRICDQHTALVA